MSDLTDDRLREIAGDKLLAMVVSTNLGSDVWAELEAAATELLAARQRILDEREEGARLVAELLAARRYINRLERVREAVGEYAQFRKDWEASVRTLKPQEAEQHFTEWAYQDAARMARVLYALDAAKEGTNG